MNFLRNLIFCFFAALATGQAIHAASLAFDGGNATGTVTPGTWQFYEVSVPADTEGWRIVLNTDSGADADLYVRQTDNPSTWSYETRSLNEAIDTILYERSDLEESTYVIGVHLPSGESGTTSFTLNTSEGYLTELSWDDGTQELGTALFTNSSTTGGKYLFKVTVGTTTSEGATTSDFMARRPAGEFGRGRSIRKGEFRTDLFVQ